MEELENGGKQRGNETSNQNKRGGGPWCVMSKFSFIT
jgi:hypothetical protein